MITSTTKAGAKKKNPPDSVRATVIIPKREYDLLSVIAKEQCRSVSAQAMFFIQEGLKDHELGVWNNENGT